MAKKIGSVKTPATKTAQARKAGHPGDAALASLAARWHAGEKMAALAAEVGISWPTLAGLFIGRKLNADTTAKDRRAAAKTPAARPAAPAAPAPKAARKTRQAKASPAAAAAQ